MKKNLNILASIFLSFILAFSADLSAGPGIQTENHHECSTEEHLGYISRTAKSADIRKSRNEVRFSVNRYHKSNTPYACLINQAYLHMIIPDTTRQILSITVLRI
jgi:hypothetical protein